MRSLGDNEIQLELEKAMRLIRMIEAEIQWRRNLELENEVRKEIILQREMALRGANGLGFILPQKRCFAFNASPSPPPAEINAAVLPNPNQTCYEGKRKAGVEEKYGFKFESKKKAKEVRVEEDWRCELCNVMTTSAKSLNDHFKGKKHMNKEKAQCRKIASQNSTNLSFEEEVVSSCSKMDAKSETKEEEPEDDDSVNSGVKSVKKH